MKFFIDKGCCPKKSKNIQSIVNEFYPYAKKTMGFDKDPAIFLRSDTKNSKDFFGKTAFYAPSSHEVHLFLDDRHPKDIVRSLSHELVHHLQNCRGEFDREYIEEPGIGESGYAQGNAHLREMEREAYLTGNMVFRDWCDGAKKEVVLMLEGKMSKEKEKKKTDKEWYNSTLFEKLKGKWVKPKGDKNGKS